MKAKELVRIIEKDGWFKVRQKGSHAHYKHPVKKNVVTVPMHKGDVAKGTEKSILKQAGLL